MGVTPARYAMGLRLQEACRLLNETTDSISEIANACGFDDVDRDIDIFVSILY
jgi:transcriptional regulator GlxA family with amidase domain